MNAPATRTPTPAKYAARAYRFTPDDLAHLQALAASSGLPEVEVLRRAIRSQPIPTPMPKVDQAALQQLAALGNNLNQAQRELNRFATAASIPPEAANAVYFRVQQVGELLLDMMKKIKEPA